MAANGGRMPRRNRSWVAILGLLTYGPMSGYDLRQLIQNSLRFFWNESYGQIYPTLKALQREGLATVEIEQQEGKPDRKVYTITHRGLDELARLLDEPPRPSIIRNEMLLRVFFGRHVSPQGLREMVSRFLSSQQEALQAYESAERALKEEGHPDEPYWVMTVDYGKHHARAMSRWAEKTLEALNELYLD
jgi:DNA-binding PadR family transcriptional regulator